MQTTAGSWYVLNETNSTTSLAIFVVVSMTPSLALNPVGGRLMDKYSPVLLIKILAPLAAIAPLAIAALFVSQALTVPLILVLTFFGSVFRALQAPTFNKILPLTVPEDQRATVLGYSGIVFNISRSVGPVIAGIAGTGLAYLFAGIGFLLVTALMLVTPELRLPLIQGRLPLEQLLGPGSEKKVRTSRLLSFTQGRSAW